MSYKPLSHRLPVWLQYVVTCVSAGVYALIGTFAHRAGAINNMPYGLFMAFMLIALSAWCARSRNGRHGLVAHMIVSTVVVWLIALGFFGNAIVIPVGFGGFVPWFSQYAGYIWLFGILVVHLVLLCMPQRWFVIE